MMKENGDDRVGASVSECLACELLECEQEIKRSEFQLRIDRAYVKEADPAEIDYFKLQVALQQIELDYLHRKLELLKSWPQNERSALLDATAADGAALSDVQTLSGVLKSNYAQLPRADGR